MPEKSDRPETRKSVEAARPANRKEFEERGGHQMVSGAKLPERPTERPASPPPSGSAKK